MSFSFYCFFEIYLFACSCPFKSLIFDFMVCSIDSRLTKQTTKQINNLEWMFAIIWIVHVYRNLGHQPLLLLKDGFVFNMQRLLGDLRPFWKVFHKNLKYLLLVLFLSRYFWSYILWHVVLPYSKRETDQEAME